MAQHPATHWVVRPAGRLTHWNLVLQIALLPAYLWLLVGKVVPVSAGTLLTSVGLYLIAPFAAA
jgi:ACR3 family arsenite efflux pump ArsB